MKPFERMKKCGEITLTDTVNPDGTCTKVQVFLDELLRVVYQVDVLRARQRMANLSLGEYGHWTAIYIR